MHEDTDHRNFIHGAHGGHGSSDHRNLNGIYTDVFWLRERKKSFVEIFNEMLLTQEIIYHSKWIKTKSLTIIFDYNAQQYVALQEGFNGDRLAARNLN